MSKKVRSNLGKVYKQKRWAERWAESRPVKRVPGGWKIMARRKRKKRKSSRRKTYRKKSSAKKARKKGQSLYKVRGGWRLSRRKRRS